MKESSRTNGFLEAFIAFQKKYHVVILLVGLLLSLVCYKRAVGLLGSVATDLIHLLPKHYPSVQLTDRIQQKFNRRSSLYVILHSSSPEVNERAIKDLKAYLEKNDLVEMANIEKQGYEYFDDNKLILMDLADVYKIHDKIKDRIQKEKLGGLYIDFEEESQDSKTDDGFDELTKNYKDKYTQGVQSRYRRNEDGTVYVADVYPKNPDSSLKFFKFFGQQIDEHLKGFDFKKYGPDLEYGYAGAIKTRVDQYDALIKDISKAGIISMASIFVLLYFHFGRYIRRKPGFKGFLKAILIRAVPVTIIFIPMIFSTLMAFCLCSFFFTQLNVVTSFLFAIIFGLGVDIGIHLVTRYIQDRAKGFDIDRVHRNVVMRTGKSCFTSVLTTVASFYILIINDFKGFSDFGWIAGNGLVVALICYLLFQPCLVLLVDRFHLLGKDTFELPKAHRTQRTHIPYAKAALVICLILTVVSVFDIPHVGFEWNFNKLKMKLAEREEQKEFLKETLGRVNSPAAYFINTPVEARKIGEVLNNHKEHDTSYPTIHFYRSYYDMVPWDQTEKLAMWGKIKVMLDDDALNALKEDERKLVDELKAEIAKIKPIHEEDIPQEIHEVFWGNTGDTTSSISYIMPLPQLELDNGYNARAFFEDVGEVKAFGKSFFAVSDSIIFAQVLNTLFHDSKIAVTFSLVILISLIIMHYRDVKRTTFVILGLLCGIFWMFALMDLFGVKLNFYNMIVIPAMIGMGEDNSVHILDRFEETGRRSIIEVLRTSGGSAFMASMTTILGYAGLCFAHHPGLNSIGWMAIIGLGTCLLGSLVLLPLLLQVFLKPKDDGCTPITNEYVPFG